MMASMTVVSTVADFDKIRNDPHSKGKVFKVSQGVFDHFYKQLQQRVTPMDDEERRALANLLCIDVDEVHGGLTRQCTCSHCEHCFSFVDHVASAVLSGAHSIDEMRHILTGPNHWLTVDTDALRVVRCPRCYLDFAAVHCCYTAHNYAYV